MATPNTKPPPTAAPRVVNDELIARANAVGMRIYKPKFQGYKHKMLLYGDPGAGKTTLAATACNVAEMQETLVVNIEGGILSVIEAKEVGIQFTPDVVDLDEWSELQDIFLFLANSKHKYNTLIIDSLSELNKLNLDYVVGKEVQRNPSKRTSIDNVYLEDHGTSSKQMRRIIRAFRDLDMHVIMTCHAASQQDKDKEEQVFPSLPPKLRESVLGFMDVVGFLFTAEKEIGEGEDAKPGLFRRMLTQPYRKWVAKDRSPGGRLGMFVDNPTMPLIFNRISGQPDDYVTTAPSGEKESEL